MRQGQRFSGWPLVILPEGKATTSLPHGSGGLRALGGQTKPGEDASPLELASQGRMGS